MSLIKQKCAFCGKEFLREIGRVNEAKKFGWRPFCSLGCQYKARITKVKAKCGNPNCEKVFFRLKNQYEQSKSGLIFCSASCAAVFNNSSRIKNKHCEICGNKFYGGSKYCSRGCANKAISAQQRVIKISKEQIIGEIQDFYKKEGRLILKREYGHYNAARDRFGNWNKAVQAAGFKPNPILYAEKQVANDGHKCDSLAEKIIDDWFTENNIEHTREVFYPNSKKFKVDFVVNGQWIEFFGLAGSNKEYDDGIKKKILIAEKFNLPFIALYPKDLFPKNKLAGILKF